MDTQRERPVPVGGKSPASLPVDAELELLRALEEEISKEAKSGKEKKTTEEHEKKVPFLDEDDDDYEDSDED
uniref:Uncharacterized protein n=1 Tax=Peronospora matthiolae TaxID=2874970 RepID=A0AAV1TL21_9STRA